MRTGGWCRGRHGAVHGPPQRPTHTHPRPRPPDCGRPLISAAVEGALAEVAHAVVHHVRLVQAHAPIALLREALELVVAEPVHLFVEAVVDPAAGLLVGPQLQPLAIVAVAEVVLLAGLIESLGRRGREVTAVGGEVEGVVLLAVELEVDELLLGPGHDPVGLLAEVPHALCGR
jgi:hypothetical protein